MLFHMYGIVGWALIVFLLLLIGAVKKFKRDSLDDDGVIYRRAINDDDYDTFLDPNWRGQKSRTAKYARLLRLKQWAHVEFVHDEVFCKSNSVVWYVCM